MVGLGNRLDDLWREDVASAGCRFHGIYRERRVRRAALCAVTVIFNWQPNNKRRGSHNVFVYRERLTFLRDAALERSTDALQPLWAQDLTATSKEEEQDAPAWKRDEWIDVERWDRWLAGSAERKKKKRERGKEDDRRSKGCLRRTERWEKEEEERKLAWRNTRGEGEGW